MGNMGFVGGKRKTAKVMKISGETIKLKTPVTAEAVARDYSGHVLLDSESVKHFGVRARPLPPHRKLEPRRLYFLVELPKGPYYNERVPRRVRSDVNVSAKERLEGLMLVRRLASDPSVIKPASTAEEDEGGDGKVRIKMRLPKAMVERMLKESVSEAEAAERILNLCLLEKQHLHSWNGGRETNRNGEKQKQGIKSTKVR